MEQKPARPKLTEEIRKRLEEIRQFNPSGSAASRPPLDPLPDGAVFPPFLIAAVSQEIKTPLLEGGVTLEPPAVGPSRLTRIVQRVWSTLWAITADGLRMLRADRRGNLYVHPIDLSECGDYSFGFTLDTGTPNYGVNTEIADYLQITTNARHWSIAFSLDGVSYSHYRHIMTGDNNFGGSYEFYIRHLGFMIRSYDVGVTREAWATCEVFPKG